MTESIILLKCCHREVSTFHLLDFGKVIIDEKELNDFIFNITDPSHKNKNKIYKDMIRKLYIVLINKHLGKVEKIINSNKTEFYKDNEDLIKIRNKLNKSEKIKELRNIYISDIKPLVNSVISRKQRISNNIKNNILYILIGFILSNLNLIFSYISKITSKFINNP